MTRPKDDPAYIRRLAAVSLDILTRMTARRHHLGNKLCDTRLRETPIATAMSLMGSPASRSSIEVEIH